MRWHQSKKQLVLRPIQQFQLLRQFEREDRVYQGTAGEGVAVDADGNVYAAEGPNSLTQAGGAFTKYSVR
jgi:hypothetical protein